MYKIRLLFITFSFLSFYNPSYAEQFASIVTGNDYGPYADKNLPEGGVYTSIVKKILTRMNYKYDVSFLPWARGYDMVKKGKIPLTFPYIKTPQRAQEVVYANESLMQTNLYLITNTKTQNANKKNLLDFKGRVFCNPIGYAQESIIQDLIYKKELKLITEFDALTCLKSIISGKADVMSLNGDYLQLLKKENKLTEGFKKIETPIAINHLYVIFPKTTKPEFMNEFNKQSREFMKTHEYKKMTEEYK